MTITSTAINSSGQILQDYTCDGKNINPPLTFSETPTKAKSLALVMEDPDAPNGLFTHWVLFNMTPATLQILENQKPLTGTEGVNDFGKLGYGGPCPPSGTHRYFFKLFVLDAVLDLPVGSPRPALMDAMEGHVIDTAELMGAYTKANP